MANQNFNTFGRGGVIADQASFDVGLRQHMIRVYNYMASGLALSGVVAFLIYNFEPVRNLFFVMGMTPGGHIIPVSMNILGWVAIFAPLGLLLLMGFRAATMSVGAIQGIYWAVTGLMGVSLSLLLFRYTGASVARTFFVTAAAFGGLSLYGYTTKRDLSAFGKFLFMGLIAYDTQTIKEQYSEAYGTSAAEKMAIFGALSLYLDFVNLFQFLMSFMGQSRD